MLKKVSFPILLFMIGIMGGIFPIFFNRDGTTLIIVGFGFGALQLYNKIQEDKIDQKHFIFIRILIIIIALAAIAFISYNAFKFVTNFNKVLSVGFVVLQLWVTYLLFGTMKQKDKK